MFDSDGFTVFDGSKRDIFARSNIKARGAFGFEYVSADPASANVVPEPGTIVLLGAGLIGLGAFARRRMNK